jgi:hypothetical protein
LGMDGHGNPLVGSLGKRTVACATLILTGMDA